MATKELFNARTQQIEEAELTVDKNNEIVATFEDGGFIKFPAGMTKAEFTKALKLHEKHNVGQEPVDPEEEAAREAERLNSLKLIGETGNTMPEGDKTNVPTDSDEANS